MGRGREVYGSTMDPVGNGRVLFYVVGNDLPPSPPQWRSRTYQCHDFDTQNCALCYDARRISPQRESAHSLRRYGCRAFGA